MRTHGTTQCRPAEAFRAAEQALLLPAPAAPYDTPYYAQPKVHPDHHAEVLRAIYSIPGDDMVGKYVSARAGSNEVKFYFKGELIKVHPRQAPEGALPTPPTCPASAPLTPCATSTSWWRSGASTARP